MAEYLVQGESITTVADAIREKGGTTAPLSFPAGMAEAVRNIQSGADLSLGLTAATVGQTVKVKAVDAEGKPTAWEAVNMPTGETWEKIAGIELAEAASLITINQDSAGRPFALKRVMIDCVVNIDQDNPMTYVKTLINGFVVCNNVQYNFNGKKDSYYAFYAEMMPGSSPLVWHAVNHHNYNWVGPIEKMGYKYNSVWKESVITKLTISADDGKKNFGIAGTKINVLGVRA